MKTTITLGTFLFALGMLLGLIQLWFTPWSMEIFSKLEITIGAFFIIVLVVWFVTKEFKEDKVNRSGHDLDH